MSAPPSISSASASRPSYGFKVTEALLGDEREPFGERGVYQVTPLGVKGLGEVKNVGVYAAGLRARSSHLSGKTALSA